MRRICAVMLVVLTAGVLVAPSAAAASSGSFVDDDGSLFESSIEWLRAEGITFGCNPPTNDRFCPDSNVTRGQMAAFLTRALDLPAATTSDLFGDDDGSPFEEAIDRLAAADITRGCNPPAGDRYCPDRPVTRGQMAAFLTRALSLPAGPSSDMFVDDDGSPFEEAIARLATAGVTRGCNPPDNDRFCPDRPVTRGQMAAFLARALSETGGGGGGGGVVDPGTCVGASLWSDAATWGGSTPVAGQHVTIGADQTVGLDVGTPSLGRLRIDGSLIACGDDISVTADSVMVTGLLQVGTEDAPYGGQFTLTLDGDPDPAGTDPLPRGLMVHGGSLVLHGTPPATTRTTLTQHSPAGDTSLRVESANGWQVGDRIVITPTDRYGTGATEERVIDERDGRVVRLTTGLDTARFGELQHVTATGLSLTPDPTFVPPDPDQPTVLDERAEVANLTRNIVIRGANDRAWRDDGIGGHVMIMSRRGTVQIDGVEMYRVGHRGVLGRYPIHWHRNSYADDGSLIGGVAGHYVRRSTIRRSSNRCFTIHATNGVTLDANVCTDIVGHGVFLEDGVERRNVITDNLVTHTRNPVNGQQLKQHEVLFDFGASGYWLSNPDNTVTGNVAADAQGPGFWLAFATEPVGLSRAVDMRPDRLRFGTFDDNTTHSNRREGVMFDNAETDDAGNVFPNQYWSTTDGQEASWPYDTLRRFRINGLTTYKNGTNGIWSRVTVQDYRGFVSADNVGRFFAGAGANGSISESLIVGTSLNNPTPYPGGEAPTAFATYHSATDMHHNTIVGFPLVAGERSGGFATNDYYVRPVDKGHVRNPDNLFIDTHPGYREDPANGMFALAGALWDPHGTWGPDGNFSVYPRPFLTHDATCVPVAPGDADGSVSNALSCDGDYFGVKGFVLERANESYLAYMAIEVDRVADDDSVVDTWEVADGTAIAGAFGNMRHFAAAADGQYELRFPDDPTPTDVSFEVENMFDTGDGFVLAVSFDGTEDAQVYASTYFQFDTDAHAGAGDFPFRHSYVEVASRQDVLDATGEVFWQDTANDLVYLRVTGGLEQVSDYSDYDEHSDELLYNLFRVRIH